MKKTLLQILVGFGVLSAMGVVLYGMGYLSVTVLYYLNPNMGPLGGFGGVPYTLVVRMVTAELGILFLIGFFAWLIGSAIYSKKPKEKGEPTEPPVESPT